ncbi:hypothetical protein Q5752_000886 [Cryptotrichosporon argae]
MHGPACLVAALAAALAARAITVVSPTNTSIWESGTLSQTVEWEAVSTDPEYFTVQLVNQNGYLADSPVTLIANQSTGAADIANGATVTYTGGASWPTGTMFQINLVATDSANAAILAQSQYFNITYSASSASSSSSSTASSASSASSSSSSSTSTSATTTTAATTTSAAASTDTVATVTADSTSAIPNAVSTSGARALGANAALLVLAAGAAKLFF